MLNSAFLSKMKEILLSQRNDILNKSQSPVDIDSDGDETDEIQAKLLMEVNKSLHSRDADRVYQIDNAIKRINDESYGLCEDCGDAIPEKRLIANPCFLTCVSCAEDREIEEKQRKRF
jgi:DnaK suppressor protein